MNLLMIRSHILPIRIIVSFILISLLISCTTSTSNKEVLTPNYEKIPLLSAINTVRQSLLNWDVDLMLKAAEQLNQIETNDNTEAFYRDYWRGTALFNAVLALRNFEEKTSQKQQESVFQDAIAALKAALSIRSDDSDSHAMLATLYGIKIRQSPFSAITLGPLVLKHRNQANQAKGDNPRVNYLEGVSSLNLAKDSQAISDALDTLLKAEQLFEKEDTNQSTPMSADWGRVQNMIFIGEAYEKLGKLEEAKKWYSMAMELAPNLKRAEEGYARCSKAMVSE